jgi:hypothetical protein
MAEHDSTARHPGYEEIGNEYVPSFWNVVLMSDCPTCDYCIGTEQRHRGSSENPREAIPPALMLELLGTLGEDKQANSPAGIKAANASKTRATSHRGPMIDWIQVSVNANHCLYFTHQTKKREWLKQAQQEQLQ